MSINKDVMDQYTEFLSQLKEFFSASTLEEILTKLGSHIEKSQFDSKEPITKIISEFLQIKQKGESQYLLVKIVNIAKLRKLILDYKDHCLIKEDMDGCQLSVLSEIYLEDFLFVVSGIYITFIEQSKASKSNKCTQMIELTIYLLKNLMLSNFYVPQLSILENEIKLRNDLNNKYDCLCLKSICTRITTTLQNFSDFLSKKYQNEIMCMAKLLQVPYASAMVYSESTIRSHLIFQLDKTTNYISSFVLDQLNMSPYVIISPGIEAQGYVMFVANINDIINSKEPSIIAVIEKVEGDEELPSNLAGCIIEHEIPQLSHIAIRARQANILCACRRKGNDIESQLKSMKFAKMRIVKGNICVETAKVKEIIIKGEERELASPSHIVQSTKLDIIMHPEKPLKEDVGTKAFNAFLLGSYAISCNLFVTPTALAIPQGVFNKYKEIGLSEILEKLDHMSEQEISNSYNEVFDQIHNVMQQNISSNESIISGIIASIISYFPTGSLLAFRSSSNMEDLAKFAGAGLYDSVLPVIANKEEIYKAVFQVWLSLYSKRALISRKKYGFPHQPASMAILVQEVINSEISFVVHTQNPVGPKCQQTIEMALGLGETLASSNIPGCPFRFSYEKGDVVLEDVASYTYKLGLDGKSYVDMTEHKILEKYEILEEYVRNIGKIGELLKKEHGADQDIEGCIYNKKVYILQTRNQI